MTEPRASWIATAALTVTAVAGLLIDPLRGLAALVAVLMFVAGAVLMGVALVIAAGRSRTKNVSIGGVFFLAESAPRSVQVQLLGSLVVQLVVGVATAAARPNTGAALGVLAPLIGLGLAGLWGARYGTFPDRADVGAPQ